MSQNLYVEKLALVEELLGLLIEKNEKNKKSKDIIKGRLMEENNPTLKEKIAAEKEKKKAREQKEAEIAFQQELSAVLKNIDTYSTQMEQWCWKLKRSRKAFLAQRKLCRNKRAEEKQRKQFALSRSEVRSIKSLLKLPYPIYTPDISGLMDRFGIKDGQIDTYHENFELLFTEASKCVESKSKTVSRCCDAVLKRKTPRVRLWEKLLSKRFISGNVLRHIISHLSEVRECLPDDLLEKELLKHFESELSRLKDAKDNGIKYKVEHRHKRLKTALRALTIFYNAIIAEQESIIEKYRDCNGKEAQDKRVFAAAKLSLAKARIADLRKKYKTVTV